MPEAVFKQLDRGRFLATELARGPWDPDAQHGGAPAALLVHAFGSLDADEDLRLARVTFEFLRPVPLGELAVSASVVRPGRRVQLIEGSIRAADGVEVVRARALRVRRAQDVPEEVAPVDTLPPAPQHGRPSDLPVADRAMFGSHAMEIRFVAGTFLDPGPSSAWFRLRQPLVEGTETTPLERLAAAADFGNGISSSVAWGEFLFINPDLTIYLERAPGGEWICLESTTRVAPDGVGLAESVLYDEHGRVGKATQALLFARR